MNKTFVIFVATTFLIAGVAFFGGMKYGQSKISGNFANLRNLSPEERQQRFQEMGAGAIGLGARNGSQAGADFVNGEIISKDNQSITVKLRDNSSKIVFYSEATNISKFVSGALADLEIGKTVAVNGKTNDDGSLTAQSIQLMPEISGQP